MGKSKSEKNKFEFEKQIEKLDEKNILFLVIERFKQVDLHPDKISNVKMGYIFEELIRKFAEMSKLYKKITHIYTIKKC